MFDVLRLDADPTSWILNEIDTAAVAADFAQRSTPIALPVISPLRGRLLLSPRISSAAFLTRPFAAPGWIPSYVRVPVPHLYVPSAATPPEGTPGYRLPAGTDLDDLEQRIIGAMRDGGRITVEVAAESPLAGTLVLDGAALRYLVLCPADVPVSPDTPVNAGSSR